MPRRKFLEQAPVEALVAQYLAITHAHYLTEPQGRERVLEALNALALVAVTITEGTEDPAAWTFFLRALEAAHVQALNEDAEPTPGSTH